MAQSEQQLKQKYQPVISLAKQLQVRLEHVHLQGEKLFIQGVAPTTEAKNKLWDQVKLIDQGYPDLTCDIAVDATAPAQPAQTMTAGASVSGGSGKRYSVQPGDTLSKISKQFYGDANQYLKIFEANRNVLSDPNQIRPGQELTIPE